MWAVEIHKHLADIICEATSQTPDLLKIARSAARIIELEQQEGIMRRSTK